MKQCWPDGDLRASLDGELPAETREAIAAHLEDCAACGARYRELEERAAGVGNLLACLDGSPVREARPAGHRRQWVAAALGLAAALAIGFVMMPKQHQAAPAVSVVQPAPQAIAAAPTPQASPHRLVHRALARQPKVVREEFLKLDDDPIETGTVVRVSAANGDVEADLLIGPDGRAHAIRMVSSQ